MMMPSLKSSGFALLFRRRRGLALLCASGGLVGWAGVLVAAGGVGAGPLWAADRVPEPASSEAPALPGAPTLPGAAAAPGLTAVPGLAQPTRLPGNGAASTKQPITVQADHAIEWHQDEKAYVARGNATATRGTTTIFGDVLTAYYRETKDKGSEVFRLTGEGHVRVVTPTQKVFGDHGVYDTDKHIAVVTGSNLRLETPTEVVTARDSLEYYEDASLAVARGDAVAVRNQDRLRADTLIASFTAENKNKTGDKATGDKAGAGNAEPATAGKPPAGKANDKKSPGKGTGSAGAGTESAGEGKTLDRLDGVGNVLITTPTDIARCQRLMYSAATDIAVLVGDVKITRGDNQINGDAAEMNMKTHVNRVLSEGKRVEGLLNPQQQPAAGEGKAGAKGEGKGKGKADRKGEAAPSSAPPSSAPPAPVPAQAP